MFKSKSVSESHIDCQDLNEKCSRKTNMPTPTKVDTNLRRSYAEKLRKSRILYKNSFKKVECNKKSHVKCIQSSFDHLNNPWITSGSIGSRDAVLVFRTSVFSTQRDDSEKMLTSASSSSSSLSSGHRSSISSDSSGSDYDLTSTKHKQNGRNLSALIKTNFRNSNKSDKPKKQVSFDNNKENVANDSKYNDDGNNSIIDVEKMPATILNIKYKICNPETKLLKKIFVSHGLSEAEENQQFSILWTGTHVKPDILRNLTPYQRINHFPRSYELTRKDCLYKNIVKMQHLRGFKHFDIVPQSFILPLEYRDLVTAHNKCRGPWIVKPAASSRGRGIFIVNSPTQIQMEEQVLVSKYIADPLCIDGHKCDIRIYVAVTSYDPLIIYMYEEGLVRLATVKYDKNVENLWNSCMHLCNYSINKYHSDYIKSNDAGEEDVGHKWTLSALLRHLKNQDCDIKQLMSNIEDLVIKSIFACTQSIVTACRMFVPNGNNCFELYGFDILIDSSLKPWLLEVNLSPSLGIDSPLDARVKTSLVADLLTLIGIPAYSSSMRSQIDNKWTRYRGSYSSGRRAHSADHLNRTSKKSSSSKTLTNEELKVIRNAKLQNARRGGFVRIFPCSESMQRYSLFLDAVTGIPMSVPPTTGSGAFTMTSQHNFNYILFNHLLQENLDTRMLQYERVLETSEIYLGRKKIIIKSIEESKRLRKQVRRLIECGNEFTQLQARQAFSQYLECVLRRLCQEPKSCHEKLILKFVNRVCENFRTPILFQNPLNYHITGKDRSAMIAKYLADFLQTYNRDTEAYIDSFDNFNMIPIKLFNEFLSQAQESDLEAILTLHTNLTRCMPFLYNRCTPNLPPIPPIPAGAFGFLKALPNMVPGGYSRDQTKIDNYYKTLNNLKENGGGDNDIAFVPSSSPIKTRIQKNVK